MKRRHLRRFCSFALGALSLACAPASAQEPTGDLFEIHEVATGTTKHQTVVTGFFRGGATAELAVVDADRRVRMYGFDAGAWKPFLEATLRPGVLFVDVANIGGRDRLLTCEPGRLSWFDPSAATERALLRIALSYEETTDAGIPHFDVTRDLNRDGRDDVVVPDVDGFWISTQSQDGTLTDLVKLGPPEPFLDEAAHPGRQRYREVGFNRETVPWYLSRVHELDYDRDGRSDLAFWNGDHFDVHRQDERGRFDPVARPFTTDVPFDSDGVYSLTFGYGDEPELSLLLGLRKKTRRTVLHSFRDMNHDGVADLLTQSLEGRSLVRQRSTYAVHLGTPTPGGTAFSPDARTSIRGGRQPLGYSWVTLEDVDGDGQVDVLLQEVHTRTGKMVRTLLSRSVSLDVELYRMEDGRYPDAPSARRTIKPRFRIERREGVFFPAVLLADVNGDGRSDLVAGKSRRQLQVFLGVPGPEPFARKPHTVAVAMPDHELNTWATDLNKDGKQDIVIHRPAKGTPRVTTLIAR